VKVVAVVVGALLALAGVAAGAGGGILLGLFGGDGTVASGSHPISTSRSALVSSVAEVSDVADVADLVGRPRLRVTARSSGSVFVGIGPARQVERYLASAPIDEVTDFAIDPFKLERRPRAGTGQPGPPARQGFWVARASGREATLRWKVRDGDYRLVLMNADASRGVRVDGDFGLTLPHIARWAWGLVIGGALLLVAGVGLVQLVLRQDRRGRVSTSGEAPASSEQPAAGGLARGEGTEAER
jgi:hypothetical protein